MQPATTATMILLLVVALAHAARLVSQATVTIAGATVPMWISVLGVVLAPVLALGLWRENAPRGKPGTSN